MSDSSSPSDPVDLTATTGPAASPDQAPAAPEEAPAIVVIGAGPAGLTAAYQLSKAGVPSTVLESDDIVGGISRTAERDGWRFDIGGHRFFTKVQPVETLWHEILADDEFLLRPRMSRIYYEGKYYDYPIKPMNALQEPRLHRGGPLRAVLRRGPRSARPRTSPRWRATSWPTTAGGSTSTSSRPTTRRSGACDLQVPLGRLRRPAHQGHVAVERRVGADPGQRLFGRRQDKSKQVTSLIEEFQYPKYGPGMMWERCTEMVQAAGSKVIMNTVGHRHPARPRHPSCHRRAGDRPTAATRSEYPATDVISSMPFSLPAQGHGPAAAGRGGRGRRRTLRFRDFLTVALVVPEADGFPDNWIYIHSPDVHGRPHPELRRRGRPYLVKDGRTCLGLEYFVFEGDGLWTKRRRGPGRAWPPSELAVLGLVDPSKVEAGYVVRMPKAYPVYDEDYKANVEVLRKWLEANTPNVHPVGRNGMHKYNNQDHSMFTAMLTVENILRPRHHDIWAVNVEEEYHEERHRDHAVPRQGTGRDAPVVPRSAPRTSTGV